MLAFDNTSNIVLLIQITVNYIIICTYRYSLLISLLLFYFIFNIHNHCYAVKAIKLWDFLIVYFFIGCWRLYKQFIENDKKFQSKYLKLFPKKIFYLTDILHNIFKEKHFLWINMYSFLQSFQDFWEGSTHRAFSPISDDEAKS